MLVGISPLGVMRLRGLAADQPLHIVNPARGLRVLLLLEHTGSLSAEETGGERVVPGKSQTQEIARPPLDGTETPSVPGTLTVPNQSSSESSLYGKTLSAEPILHRSGFVRETTALPNQNRNHRLAPHNSARQTGAKARAGRSPEQAPTEASTRRANPPDQAAPRYTNRNRQPQWRPAISVAEIRNY